MKKYAFSYIHSNHTTPLINGLKLPQGIQPRQIKNLTNYPYHCYAENIILFSLTGQPELREQEEKLVKNVLVAPINTTFLIITPFNFEAKVNLSWVHEHLNILRDKNVNFEPLELDSLLKEKPHLTFDQAFSKIQEVIELIAATAYGTFRG